MKKLKQICINDFLVTESLHPPGFYIPFHSHPNASIVYVLQGSFKETFGRKEFNCSDSSLLIKPGGQIHSNSYGLAGARTLILEVKPKRLNSINSITMILDKTFHLRDPMISFAFRQLYGEFLKMDRGAYLVIEGIILQILGYLARKTIKGSKTAEDSNELVKATKFILENFTYQISLIDVARNCGVHPAYLARMFRKHHHCSIGDYIRKLRLTLASQLLADSNKSLTEIAQESGFYDHSHFSTAFRNYTGFTPSKFRILLKTGNTDTNKF